MGKLVLLACVCIWVLAWSSRAYAADAVPVSKEAQATLKRIQELLNVTFHSLGEKLPPMEKFEKIQQAARLLDEALDKLAGQLDEAAVKKLQAAEGQDIDTKLALLAWDRKQRPEVYKEIAAKYFHAPDNPLKRVPSPPEVDKAHATEKYRLAWEYFLLLPDEENFIQSAQVRSLQALAAIRKDASLVTLVRRYRITCQEGIKSPQVDTEQTHVMLCLSEFCNAHGLRALLECLDLSKKQQSKQGEKGWDVEGLIYAVLTDLEKRGTRKEWLKIIAAFLKDGLSADQRQLLEKAAREK